MQNTKIFKTQIRSLKQRIVYIFDKQQSIIILYQQIYKLNLVNNQMSRTIYFQLPASQDIIDEKKQTLYCINSSKKLFQHRKKQSFLNKLSFDYSLQKINKQKFIGNLIPFTSRAYPSIKCEGNKLTNVHYSSDIFKRTRERLISQRNQMEDPQDRKNKQQMRKFRQIITQRKNQQGGIDSFWIFKKSPNKQEKKKKVRKGTGLDNIQIQSQNQNKVQQAYIKILNFSKLPLELENSLIPKNSLKNYISSVFGQTFCLWFISFYQIKSYINFKQFQIMCQRFKNISLRQCHLVSFFLYDDNGDGFLCPRDLFAIFQREITPKIDMDILSIGDFVKNNVGIQNTNNQQYKIQNVCIRDDWLTIKDYEMYFKKVDQPYLKATNKKDTVFSKSFAVIDHRERVRSKRRQMNEKKNLYEELYGQISKMKKNQAHIDSQSDYKLNYTLFIEIFGKKSTQLYDYFTSFLFGIEPKQFQ